MRPNRLLVASRVLGLLVAVCGGPKCTEPGGSTGTVVVTEPHQPKRTTGQHRVVLT